MIGPPPPMNPGERRRLEFGVQDDYADDQGRDGADSDDVLTGSGRVNRIRCSVAVALYRAYRHLLT